MIVNFTAVCKVQLLLTMCKVHLHLLTVCKVQLLHTVCKVDAFRSYTNLKTQLLMLTQRNTDLLDDHKTKRLTSQPLCHEIPYYYMASHLFNIREFMKQ